MNILKSRWTYIFNNYAIRLRRCLYSSSIVNFVGRPPPLDTLVSPSDISAAQAWILSFRSATIPRELVDLSFARSSGPGGQNVNKVNTKAIVRCPLAAPWIPQWAKPSLQRSSAYVSSSRSLLVTSTVHRSQAQNVDECLTKLQSLILKSAQSMIKTETSAEQKTHVQKLQRIQDIRRRQSKFHRSKVKSLRSKKDWDQ